MKKAFIFVLIISLLLVGCTRNKKNASSQTEVPSESRDVFYSEGIWSEEDWQQIEVPFEEECVPDKETAIAVTSVFLEGFQKQGYFRTYVAQSVFYDVSHKIWFVTFSEKELKPGACLTIAIRQDDAQVVKMWVGE